MNNNPRKIPIGEFALLSGMSVKALRYYDHIGLLVPHEIDKVSGYRYYSRDQLKESDGINFAREMNVPLGEFKERFLDAEGKLKEAEFLSYSKVLLQERQTRLDQLSWQIDSASEKKDYRSHTEFSQPKIFHFPERILLLSPTDKVLATPSSDYEVIDLIRKYLGESHELSTEFGMLYWNKEKERRTYIFFETRTRFLPMDHDFFLRLPAGNYSCQKVKSLKEAEKVPGRMVFVHEIVAENPYFEVASRIEKGL